MPLAFNGVNMADIPPLVFHFRAQRVIAENPPVFDLKGDRNGKAPQ
jgi:hypothetical protein